jgi:hypothetical protein
MALSTAVTFQKIRSGKQSMLLVKGQALNFLRPLARLRRITFRPAALAMRALKP